MTEPIVPTPDADPLHQLRAVMRALRDPQHGCPWDLEQTLQSLTRYTLEEVYEVVDAIESGTDSAICEELGDLLFQVVFYAQIADEQGRFQFDDVAATITEKLLRRHPHVFPDGTLASFGAPQSLDTRAVLNNWEAIKAEERRLKSAAGAVEPVGVLADVPRALPALERAAKLQGRAAKVGFDWDTAEPVLAKLEEEISELRDAMTAGSRARQEEELGDVLFAVVNLARHLDLDGELALRQANRKFVRRFEFIENRLRAEGRELHQVELAELDRYWDLAKQDERS